MDECVCPKAKKKAKIKQQILKRKAKREFAESALSLSFTLWKCSPNRVHSRNR